MTYDQSLFYLVVSHSLLCTCTFNSNCCSLNLFCLKSQTFFVCEFVCNKNSGLLSEKSITIIAFFIFLGDGTFQLNQ